METMTASDMAISVQDVKDLPSAASRASSAAGFQNFWSALGSAA